MWLVVMTAMLALAAPSNARADATATAGDVLQYGIPALALGLTAYRQDREGAGQLAISGLVSTSITWTLKVTVDEKRPSGGGRGFPSGHSSTAAFGAGFVHRRYGLLPALPLYTGTAFVAWSRVDARAHRTLDVVAGVAIGLATSLVLTTPLAKQVAVVPLAVRGGLGAMVVVAY